MKSRFGLEDYSENGTISSISSEKTYHVVMYKVMEKAWQVKSQVTSSRYANTEVVDDFYTDQEIWKLYGFSVDSYLIR